MHNESNDHVNLTLAEVHDLALNALLAKGLSADQATGLADIVTAAERDECTSHGLFRIPFYAAAVDRPETNPTAVPTVSQLAPGVVHVDGQFGYAPLALKIGLPLLADCARSQGIAALSIVNTVNIAALWHEVESLAEQGLVAFAFVSAKCNVAPAGGTKPLFGTNPMAFGWPRAGHPPLVFDQASSVSARGEIQLHLREGKPLPPDWAIGPDGEPTTDPATALDGAQLAFGGHKGAAIALMVELLAGALVGDMFSFESSAKGGAPAISTTGGEFVIAIDPTRCVLGGDGPAQAQRAEQLFAKILEQDGTRLPSDRRYAARQRTPTDGVQVAKVVYDQIKALID